MFGHNSITGKKFFSKAAETQDDAVRLLVTSIFYTFQGEGPFTGRPALFVRLAKCNLACSFCDAYFEEGDWMTFEEILTEARKQIEGGAEFAGDVRDFVKRNVGLVVTGGEPMLQDALGAFFGAVQHKFAWLQVETNGTQNLAALPKVVKVVVSPKCSEKGGKAVKYLEPHPSVAERATCLKFVVTADPESPYYDIPDWAKKMPLPVYVSPMNVYARLPAKAVTFLEKGQASLEQRSTVDEVVSFWEEGLFDRRANKANHEHAASLAVRRGYIFNLQQHLYGSKA